MEDIDVLAISVVKENDCIGVLFCLVANNTVYLHLWLVPMQWRSYSS